MRFFELCAEAWRSMVAAKVASIMVAFLCATMSVVSITTVGKTVFAEEQLQQRMDEAGSRSISIAASAQGVMSAGLVETFAPIDAVNQIIGTTKIVDSVGGAAQSGPSVPTAFIVGNSNEVAVLLVGRVPQVGEALVTASAMATLGMDAPVGSILDSDGITYAVVGQYEPRAPFQQFDQAIVMAPNSHDTSLQTLTLVGQTAGHMPILESLLLQAIAPQDSSDLNVTSALSLSQLHKTLEADFGNYSRSLLLVILVGGGTLLGVVVLADTLMHRKDFGRRRALGVLRSELTLLVTLRTLYAALIGTLIGVGISIAVNYQSAISLPWSFIVAISLLVLMCCAAFSALPAVLATYRDPVAVLRTP